MPEIIFWLAPVLFFISMAYTSVGLGGGSSYVAFLYLFGIPLAKIPAMALFFNITAASTAVYKFGREGYLKPRLVLPFLVASVPATFFAARLDLEERVLSLIFALVLFFISLFLIFKKKASEPRFHLKKKTNFLISFLLGALLGFLAGLMGIGGGVFLGPVMLLIGLVSPHYVAGTCSAFVLVNSTVGLFSHYLQGNVDFSVLLLLGIVVFGGARLGSFLGSKKFSPLLLQRIFAVFLLVASLKMGIGVLG